MSFKCFKLLNYRTSSVEGEGGRGGGGGGRGVGGSKCEFPKTVVTMAMPVNILK